jgi:hypothetical protein
MLMKKYLTFTVAALFATIAISNAAPDKDALMAKEKAAYQAFKDKNVDDFKKVVSPDVVTVYAEGMNDMEKELSDMKKWDMKSFEMSDYKVIAAGADTVISTYKVKIEGTVDGKDSSGSYNAATVWERKKGQWWAIFHTDMKEQPAS